MESLEGLTKRASSPAYYVCLVVLRVSGAGNGLNDMLKLPVSLATFNNGSAASVTDMLRVATNLTTLQASQHTSSRV